MSLVPQAGLWHPGLRHADPLPLLCPAAHHQQEPVQAAEPVQEAEAPEAVYDAAEQEAQQQVEEEVELVTEEVTTEVIEEIKVRVCCASM